jgi:putative salt-induced outer membrane protein YdiY
VLGCTVLAPLQVRAQEGVLQPFMPKPPSAGRYDWIRLTSGEWLKGEIRVMRKEVMEFESDELDELNLDWDKIREVRSPGPTTFVFEERTVVVGSGAIDAEHVVIRVLVEEGEEPREEIHERAKLVAIIRGAFNEWKRWRGGASVGVTVRTGNTETAEFYSTGTIIREDSFSRATLDYTGSIGSTDGVRNVDNHRANLSLDIYVSRRLYVIPGAFEVRSDQFQNIAYRLIPTAGVGYDIIDWAKFEWNCEVTSGYRYTQRVSVQPGNSLTDQDGIFSVSSSVDWELTKRTDIEAYYQIQVGIPDPAATDQHAQVKLSVELTRYVDLDVTYDWDFIGQPIESVTGEVPEQNDQRLAVSFALDF